MFLTLFLTFLKIGAFTFGGGYAMIALIQNEVVVNHAWLTAQEFTDILAISQMTPGPIGINTATYTGYTAVLNAGYSVPCAVVGAVLASLAVILVPVTLMLLVSRLLARYKDMPVVRMVLRLLRLVIVGVIASAALVLLTPDNFGSPDTNTRQFIISLALFVAVFVCSVWPKRQKDEAPQKGLLRRPGPITLLLLSGLLGLVLY